MPGLSVHTPTIIIRLLGESMRSQAVSTLVMRSPVRPSTPLAALHGLSLPARRRGLLGATMRVTMRVSGGLWLGLFGGRPLFWAAGWP